MNPLHIKRFIHNLSTKQYCPFINRIYQFCKREIWEILYILKQLNQHLEQNLFLFSILEDTIEFKSKHRLNYLTKTGKKNTRKTYTFNLINYIWNLSPSFQSFIYRWHWTSSRIYGHFTGCNIKVKKRSNTQMNSYQKELENLITFFIAISNCCCQLNTEPSSRLNSWTIVNGLLPTYIYQTKYETFIVKCPRISEKDFILPFITYIDPIWHILHLKP